MNNTDIDIDFGSRDKLLNVIQHYVASIRNENGIKKHNSGIYVTEVPYDPLNDLCSLDYKEAEFRGYMKLDLLNVHLYNEVKSEEHLLELMKEPNWEKLYDKDFCSKLIHIGNHYNTLLKMPEKVNSIPRLAMFLSVIRPSKKHLIGLSWKEVSKTVWEKENDDYMYKKSHAISYAHLVVVNMNLLSG